MFNKKDKEKGLEHKNRNKNRTYVNISKRVKFIRISNELT